MTHDELSKYVNNFLSLQQPVIKSFPLSNIYTRGEEEATIEVALAGYSPQEIKVVQRPLVDSSHTKLEISCEEPREDTLDREYIRREVSFRTFKKEFLLIPYIEVESIKMKDGLLIIKLKRKLPKNLEPKTFTIE